MEILTEEAKVLLRDSQISDDLKKVILQKIVKVGEDAPKVSNTGFWSGFGNSTVIVALIGVLTVFANYLVTAKLNNQNAMKEQKIAQLKASISQKEKELENSNKINDDARSFSYKIIENEMSRTTDTTERAEILYFLSSIGMLPGLNNAKLEEFAKNDITNPGSVGIPSALGLNKPDYHVATLTSLSGISPNSLKLINLAIGELNKNYLETDSPENVKMYWSSIGGKFVSEFDINIAWSGAFTSWLLKQSDVWPGFKPTPVNVEIWNQALKSGLTFQVADKSVRPGDIIFLLGSDWLGSTCDIDDIRRGNGEGAFCQGTTGVVYSVSANVVSVITGNRGNAVRLADYDFNNEAILGFARL